MARKILIRVAPRFPRPIYLSDCLLTASTLQYVNLFDENTRSQLQLRLCQTALVLAPENVSLSRSGLLQHRQVAIALAAAL